MPIGSDRLARYDAIFFDLDDTLTVTRATKFAMHRSIARERYGRELTDAEIGLHYHKPLEQSLRDLYDEQHAPADELFAMVDEYRARFPRTAHPRALEVIGTLLDAGMAVGVVTGTPEPVAIAALADLDFPIERMIGVFCYNDAHPRKPEPAVFIEVRAAVGARLGRAPRLVYVGDALEDHQAAHAVGIDFIGVTTGEVTAETFRAAGAEQVVPDLAGVLSLLGLPHQDNDSCSTPSGPDGPTAAPSRPPT